MFLCELNFGNYPFANVKRNRTTVYLQYRRIVFIRL